MSTLAGLSDIEIRITADLARLKADMDQARKAVGDAFGGMRGAADSLKGVLGGLFAGLSVTALSGWVKGAIDAADAMQEMSGRVGVSVEELSRLKVAYQMAGLGTETMQSSLSKLSKNIADGGGALDTLGIKTRNADGSLRNVTGVLEDLSDEFAGIKDGTAKTALAMEIFGKSGADMVPLLNEGSEGLREMAKLAEDLGVALDKKTGDRAAEFNDTLDALGLASQGAATKLASELLPTLNAVAGAMLDGAKGSNVMNGAAGVLSVTMKTLYAVGSGVGEVFSTVGNVLGTMIAQLMAGLGGVADIFKSLIKGDFGGAEEAFRRSAREVKAIQAESAAATEARWAETGKRIQAVWDGTSAASGEAAGKLIRQQKEIALQSEKAKKAQADAAKKHADEMARLTQAGQQYLRSLGDQGTALRQQLALGRDLTASEKALAALERDLREGKIKLTTAEVERARAQIASNQSLSDAVALTQALAKNEADLAKFAAQSLADSAKETASLQEQVKQQREQNDQIGATKDQLAALEQARLDDAIASKQQQIAMLEGVGHYPAERAEIEKQIAALTELKTLKAEGGAKTVAVDAAVEAQRAWEQTAQSIGQGLTDSLFRAFESGKGFFKTLWDGIKNTFKTTTLKLLISGQDGKGGIMGTVMQALGLGGGGTGGGGGGGNFLSSLSSMFSGGMGNIGSMLTTAGNAMGWGGLSAFGSGMGMTGTQASAAAGAYNAAGMTGTGSAIGWGQNVAAFAPWAALIAAGMMASDSAFSKGFNEDTFSYTQAWHATGGIAPPTMKMDTNLLQKLGVDARTANVITGASLWSKAFGHGSKDVQEAGIDGMLGGGAFTGQQYADWKQKGGWFRSDKTGTDRSAVDATLGASLNEAASGILEQTKRYAEALGLPAQSLADVQQQIRVKLGEDAAANSKAIEAAMVSYAEALSGTFGAEIGPLRHEGETLADAMSRMGASLEGANAVMQGLNLALFDTSVAGGDAASQLVDLFGGLANLGTLTADYYGRYYTQAEQAAIATQSLTETLADVGLTLPDTKAAFKDLVEAQNLTTESGREAFATLMSVAGAFDTLHASAESERLQLETRLLELQGDTAALRQRELEALDPANRSLQEMIWSLEDAASAAQQAGNAMVTMANGSRMGAKEFAGLAAAVTDDQIRSAYGIRDGLQSGSAPGMTPDQLRGLSIPEINYAVGSATWMSAAANSLAMGTMGYDDPVPNYMANSGGGSSGASPAMAEAAKLRESMDRLSDGLLDYLRDLRQGDLSTLSPEQKYLEAKAAFAAVANQANATTLLKTSRAYNASGAGYVSDFATVEALLSKLAKGVEQLNETTEAGVVSNERGLAGVEDATHQTRRAAERNIGMQRLAEQERVS